MQLCKAQSSTFCKLYRNLFYFVSIGGESVTSEMHSLFGPEKPGPSKVLTQRESFTKKAERLCDKFISGTITQGSVRRKRRPAASVPRVKEWMKNIVLIDYQGQRENDVLPLYDYNKIFDGLISLNSEMSEEDVRQEIVRLVHLKSLPTHNLERLTTYSFSFVRVVNRKVRCLDGDVSCGDGKGINCIYKSGSIYVRLNDESLWAKKVIMLLQYVVV